MTPDFRIEVKGSDSTDMFKPHMISIDTADNAGFDSDTVQITLDNAEGKLAHPQDDAEVTVWLGYKDDLTKVGIYKVNGVNPSGAPARLTIKANAANMKTSLKESKSRSWDDITLDTLITQIAGEHDLEPIVGSDLKAVHYDHIDQTEESDLHLLTRLASDLDAVSKPTHQKLVFVTRGDEKSATGQELPTVELKPADVTNWSANLSDRWKYKSVIARYHSLDEAVEKEVKVGTGSPTQTIRRTYATEEEAKRAAQGRYNRYKRGKGKLMITMPGNATVYAETPLSLSGFGEGVDTKWVVTTVKHRLNKQGGFFTQLEAELKD